MSKNDTGRVVVITGASSGLGKASAHHFASKGWRVGLVARGEPGLEATLAEVESLGARGYVAIADVSDAAQLDRAADEIESNLGPIDVWANVAGTGTYSFFHEAKREDFERVLQTNLIGSINGTRTAMKRMVPRNRGTIVQVASAIAYRGIPLQSAYATSKWALRGFHESVRAEMAHLKSDVVLTLVNPPGINTPFFAHAGCDFKGVAPHVPMPVYQPELIADAVYHAATHRRREWNVADVTVVMMVADKILPKTAMDWIVGKLGVEPQLTERADVIAERDPTLHSPSKRVSGTHGPFNSEARNWSVTWWMTKNPGLSLMLSASAVYGLHRAAKRYGI